MFIVFIATMIVLIIAGSIAYILQTSIDDTCCISIVIVVFILYICGITGILSWGILLIEVLSIFFAGGVLFHAFLNGNISRIKEIYFTRGMLALLLMYIIWAFLIRDRGIYHWDEFSHWGLTVKNMWILRKMPFVPESSVTFKAYPPGSALFQYFFAGFSNSEFKEYTMYYAYNLMAYSFLMPLYRKVKKNYCFVFLLALLLPCAFFKSYYTLLLVDGMLGVIFASLIILLYLNDEINSKVSLLQLAASSMILPLIKSSGFGLALIAALIMLAAAIKRNKPGRKWRIPLLCIGCAVVTRGSWNVCLAINNVDRSFYALGSNERTLAQAAAFFKTFIIELLTGNKSRQDIKMSVFLWIILFIICEVLIYKESQKNTFLINVGVLVYTIFLCYIYLFNMSYKTAMQLGSFSRYISPILLGTCLALCMLLLENKYTIAKMIVLSIVFAIAIPNAISGIKDSIEKIEKSKLIQAQYLCPAMSDLNSKDRVCFVAQNTQGTPYNMSIYVNAPVHFNICKSYSIGKAYSENDIITQEVSKEEFLDFLINNCEYIYIYQADEQFIKLFGAFFCDEIEGRTLYRVVKGERDMQVLLERKE